MHSQNSRRFSLLPHPEAGKFLAVREVRADSALAFGQQTVLYSVACRGPTRDRPAQKKLRVIRMGQDYENRRACRPIIKLLRAYLRLFFR